MLYSEEQIRRANERSISEYFRQAGYSCKRAGSETHIDGFGGFYVNDTTIPNKFYIHSQQKGGVGLVNCLMKVMDMPFKEAVRAALDGELGQGERTDGIPNYAPLYRKAEPTVPEPKLEFIMPEKGENDHRVFSYLITGLNCSTDSQIAYKEMEQNFELYSEERFWKKSLFMKKDILGGKERVRLHHYIQSFKAGEVTKEEAHRIGLEWAKEMFGDKFQVLVSTHTGDRNSVAGIYDV